MSSNTWLTAVVAFKGSLEAWQVKQFIPCTNVSIVVFATMFTWLLATLGLTPSLVHVLPMWM